MSYCLNPNCSQPQNPLSVKFCLSCGTQLLLKDRYRAIQPLGQGGMGRTFLSVDEHRLKSRCVIKQLLPAPEIQGNSKALKKAVELFEQEALRLLELGEQHPQIPALLAYFEQDKRLYLVQQLIEGQDLWQELEENGPFSEEQIRQLLSDLLPVLQFVHEHQVIHRDIKPTNIIRRKSLPSLSKGGKADLVLIDFGVSKQLSSTGIHTGTRTGTEGYAPIEQLRNGQAYPASDIYSLGVTCIHLLTQTPLDELFDPMIGQWRWRSVLQQRGTDVSPKLALILDKMLKEWVNERYQNAGDVVKDLNAGQSKVGNSPLLLLQEAAYRPVATTPVVSRPVSDRPLTTAHHNISLSQSSALSDTFLTTSPPPRSAPVTWRRINILKGHSRYVNAVAFSPLGNLLASGSSDKTIKLWQLDNGKLLATFTGHSDDVNSLAFSPEGQYLASGSLDRTIKLWQLDTGKLLGTFAGHSDSVLSVAFSPGGQFLASGSWDKTVKVIHLPTGKLLYTLGGHGAGVRTVAFSPDGKILASGCWDKTINLWKMENGELLETLGGHLDPVSSLAFSPRSVTLVSGSEDKTIKIWQFDKRGELTAPTRTLAGHSNWVNTVSINPRSPILASGSRDKTIKLWHLQSGQLLQTLSGESYTVNAVIFSPDGQTLVSGSEDKTIKIWRMFPIGKA
ncbi:serine/threonine protein kinase [Ancylothrix sp. C2]|uniref:serine/threonine-protein kinase n=1 Tax=Ancylothrix sp. D3o TaxID=2953691 RepID=UPI0021BA6F3F|nr:serine/threonine-protein kinase [Ancylothrix sp. D3o]MCT7952883.1 serine/threonine protein kinase [Ancylothrix sp. D3o]